MTRAGLTTRPPAPHPAPATSAPVQGTFEPVQIHLPPIAPPSTPAPPAASLPIPVPDPLPPHSAAMVVTPPGDDPPAISASDRSVLDRFLLPSLPESETKINRSLLGTRLEIQGNTNWTRVDTGSVSNIVSAGFYQSLPAYTLPRDPTPEPRGATHL